MAPVDTDSDNNMSARKNLCIVFLHSDRRESNPNSTWHDRDRPFRLQTPRTAATRKPEALVNAAKFTAPPPRIAGSAGKLNDVRNNLISKHYFSINFFSQLAVPGRRCQRLNARVRNLA